MSRTPDEISAKIRASLAVSMPGLSCEIGTPERKIIDACAEAIAEAYIDQYLVGSLLDIDGKTGIELEQFVGIFGFGRLQGSPAEGVVRVTALTASTTDTVFSLGSSFYTQPNVAGTSQTLYYSSIQPVVLVAGDTSCDIPVRCQSVGTMGNIPPDSIAYQGELIGGSTVTNLSAMTGGVDIETDQELRQRFKDTLLRNVAGTADWYEALCQQNNNVSRVKVFGPVSMYRTQIEVPAAGVGDEADLVLPITADVKYAWPGMESVFTNLGQADEQYFSPINDYTFFSGSAPGFSITPDGGLDDDMVGEVVDLEFQYTTRSSRNDPLAGITNKVDVFVDGVDPVSVREATVVVASTLSNSSSNALYTGKFRRVGTSGAPTSGNRFMRLGSTPIVSFPSTLTIGGVVYTQGTAYHLLASTTLLAGSHQEISGIEWTGAGPATNTQIPGVTYVYNRTPEIINAIIQGAKQICTDVMVHQATVAYIKPCFQVEYDRGYTRSVVDGAIINRLQQFFAQLPFGSQVKLSSLCMMVQQTLGVVDVKVTTSVDDSEAYGVQIYDASSDVDPSVVQTTDFKLNDNQVATYQGVEINRVAAP